MFIFLFVEDQTVKESTPTKLKKYDDPSNQINQMEKEGNIYNSIFKLNKRKDYMFHSYVTKHNTENFKNRRFCGCRLSWLNYIKISVPFSFICLYLAFFFNIIFKLFSFFLLKRKIKIK